ncbi:MAG TPA: hypothetical protein VFJ86_06170, partial [Usitatibacter sp.]|nr:hypothetical protein [Usitatibacter sp.]
MPRALALLFALMLASCGGGGGGGSVAVSSGPSGGGGGTVTSPALPTAGMRVEESDAAVSTTGAWSQSDKASGWSGGSAIQATTAGATVSISFNGTSIRWIGSRGRGMGIAQVSVDSGPVKEVDLFGRPSDEIHTPIFTVYDLAAGKHTLTITATGRQNGQAEGNAVVVDAFDIQPD